jgi:hypothetical protein
VRLGGRLGAGVAPSAAPGTALERDAGAP